MIRVENLSSTKSRSKTNAIWKTKERYFSKTSRLGIIERS